MRKIDILLKRNKIEGNVRTINCFARVKKTLFTKKISEHRHIVNLSKSLLLFFNKAD